MKTAEQWLVEFPPIPNSQWVSKIQMDVVCEIRRRLISGERRESDKLKIRAEHHQVWEIANMHAVGVVSKLSQEILTELHGESCNIQTANHSPHT